MKALEDHFKPLITLSNEVMKCPMLHFTGAKGSSVGSEGTD